jgi:hypothetical protein
MSILYRLEHPVNTLVEILHSKNIKEASQSSVLTFIGAELADVAKTLARVDPNKVYNIFTAMHITVGAGVGSYFYRRLGTRGIAAYVVFATAFNFIWETYEAKVGASSGTLDLDTVTDILAVYGGGLAGVGWEKMKERLAVRAAR